MKSVDELGRMLAESKNGQTDKEYNYKADMAMLEVLCEIREELQALNKTLSEKKS